jgi:hypothetical protein
MLHLLTHDLREKWMEHAQPMLPSCLPPNEMVVINLQLVMSRDLS